MDSQTSCPSLSMVPKSRKPRVQWQYSAPMPSGSQMPRAIPLMRVPEKRTPNEGLADAFDKCEATSNSPLVDATTAQSRAANAKRPVVKRRGVSRTLACRHELPTRPTTPTGSRTPVFGLRTRRPGPLDDGGGSELSHCRRSRDGTIDPLPNGPRPGLVRTKSPSACQLLAGASESCTRAVGGPLSG